MSETSSGPKNWHKMELEFTETSNILCSADRGRFCPCLGREGLFMSKFSAATVVRMPVGTAYVELGYMTLSLCRSKA